MLGLHWDTPPDWAAQALADPAPLLLDHLFCERKAAATAIVLLKRHGERLPRLEKVLRDLAAEELAHADRVTAFLQEYPLPKKPDKGGNRYAQGLRRLCRTKRDDNLVDMLLVASLIEARSAERFRLLADHAGGSALGNFYADLYAAEVGHFKLFLDIAMDFQGEERAGARLEEMRRAEAEIIRALPSGPRIH